MVWEQGSCVIVALTRPSTVECGHAVRGIRMSVLVENGMTMCHHYWPVEGSARFNDFEVELSGSIERSMSTRFCLGQPRLGTHLVGRLLGSQLLLEKCSNHGDTHRDSISLPHLGRIEQPAIGSSSTGFSPVCSRVPRTQMRTESRRLIVSSRRALMRHERSNLSSSSK